ncbi:MAG: hypothetical protein PUP46_07655 [Endozoicomonas sp. (ex Botrylloides leachii)]|nr:hypothetical protein [Endozoicomonas sp. (ex Botrylloides leachii)]
MQPTPPTGAASQAKTVNLDTSKAQSTKGGHVKRRVALIESSQPQHIPQIKGNPDNTQLKQRRVARVSGAPNVITRTQEPRGRSNPISSPTPPIPAPRRKKNQGINKTAFQKQTIEFDDIAPTAPPRRKKNLRQSRASTEPEAQKSGTTPVLEDRNELTASAEAELQKSEPNIEEISRLLDKLNENQINDVLKKVEDNKKNATPAKSKNKKTSIFSKFANRILKRNKKPSVFSKFANRILKRNKKNVASEQVIDHSTKALNKVVNSKLIKKYLITEYIATENPPAALFRAAPEHAKVKKLDYVFETDFINEALYKQEGLHEYSYATLGSFVKQQIRAHCSMDHCLEKKDDKTITDIVFSAQRFKKKIAELKEESPHDIIFNDMMEIVYNACKKAIKENDEKNSVWHPKGIFIALIAPNFFNTKDDAVSVQAQIGDLGKMKAFDAKKAETIIKTFITGWEQYRNEEKAGT